jgi:septal ring factor EnvC (AmiA/AmiB activator)
LQDSVLIQRELAEMQKSQGIADNQVRLGQDERSKLDKDFAQYKKELDVIGAEAQRLQEDLQSTRAEVSSTFKQIQALRDQIVARQRALSEAINAVSGTPNP